MDKSFINACEFGNIETVRELLNNLDLAPMSQDECGWNGLDFACDNGDLEIVRLLLADPRVGPAESDNFALSRAIYGYNRTTYVYIGFPDIVKLMLKDGRCSIPSYIVFNIVSDSVKQVIDEHMFRLDGPIYNQNILE